MFIRELTVVVWNVGVDVVADEQLDDVVAVNLASVTERRASDIIARVDVRASRQQQPHGHHPRLLLLDIIHMYPSAAPRDMMKMNCDPDKMSVARNSRGKSREIAAKTGHRMLACWDDII